MIEEIVADTGAPTTVVPEQQVTPSAPEVTPSAPTATPKTALETPAEPAAPGPADWPDDWREKLAGTDEKLLSRLKRFTALPHVFQQWREAERTISAAEHKRWAPGDAADEAAIATFRKDRGIPDAPDAYLAELPDGYVIGENDKPAFEKFAEVFHANHVPAEVGRKLVTQYFEAQRAAQDARMLLDEQQRVAAVDTSRAEMGPDYAGNRNAVISLLDGLPEDTRIAVMEARDPQGNKIFNNPSVFKQFAIWAKELMPAATIVPGDSASAGETIDAEMASIVKQMGNMHSDYWKGPKSPRSPGETVAQVRYRELFDAKNRLRK